MEPETFTITIAGRPFTCRRPTQGELDLGKLQRLYGVFVGYQRRIAEVEANPEEGAAERIASFVAIGAEAAEKVRDLARRALERITDPAAAKLLSSEAASETEGIQRGISIAEQLFEALVQPAALPK